jgi:hypothetical protein
MTLNSWVLGMIRVSQVGMTFCGETDDRLDSVHGHPSFSRILVTVLIVAGGVLR